MIWRELMLSGHNAASHWSGTCQLYNNYTTMAAHTHIVPLYPDANFSLRIPSINNELLVAVMAFARVSIEHICSPIAPPPPLTRALHAI